MNENLNREMEQRKKAEQDALRAFEKEKDLGELKSRFVSMASHEFRTPLSGILTSATLIDKHHQSGDSKKVSKHVGTIKASVRNLTNILNDFLSLDKLDAGRIESRPTSFSLADLAKDLTQDMQSLAKKGQRIVHEHRGETKVSLDQEILRNVLINLLSNALKYSPEDAAIRFTTEADGARVVIAVIDEGIGIPEAERKHLFERFFRARNASTVPGTGLGLNIVKRYLDLMGGAIECTSKENAGTTFVVTLPNGPGRTK